MDVAADAYVIRNNALTSQSRGGTLAENSEVYLIMWKRC